MLTERISVKDGMKQMIRLAKFVRSQEQEYVRPKDRLPSSLIEEKNLDSEEEVGVEFPEVYLIQQIILLEWQVLMWV